MIKDSAKAIITGYGLAGSVFHAPLLKAAGFEVAAIVVRDAARRAQAAADCPSAVLCDDLNQALSISDAALVVLATPTDTHAPLAKTAFNAGRHVVIDKPFAVSATEADTVIAAARAADKHVIPFQNRRWDADFLTLKQLIDNDELGDIVRYEARFDRFNPIVKDRWRERDVGGGGLLYDLGPHLIDQAVQLFGAPDWVFCTRLKQRAGAMADDGFELVFGRDSGDYPYVTLGSSLFSPDTPHGAPRFKVNGRRATWLKAGFDPQEAELRRGTIPSRTDWIAESPDARGRLISGAGEVSLTSAGVGEWTRFYDGVMATLTHNAQPPVVATDARLTCAIIDACIRSSTSGQRIYI